MRLSISLIKGEEAILRRGFWLEMKVAVAGLCSEDERKWLEVDGDDDGVYIYAEEVGVIIAWENLEQTYFIPKLRACVNIQNLERTVKATTSTALARA
jgi:hypothetical protein